jgi:hypothetical protein
VYTSPHQALKQTWRIKMNTYVQDITAKHADENISRIGTIQFLINRLKLVPEELEFITNYFQEIKTEMYWKIK